MRARATNRVAIYPDKIGQNFLTQTGGEPRLFLGAGVDFEIGFFRLDDTLLDISNITDLTLHLKPKGHPSEAPVALKTISAAAMNPAMTLAQWADGSSAHAVISLLGSETAIPAGDYDVTISGHTLDDALDLDVFGVSVVRVLDAGISNLAAPPLGDDPAVTLAQLEALLANFVRFGKNPAGKTLTLVSPNGQRGVTVGCNDDGTMQTDLEDYTI